MGEEHTEHDLRAVTIGPLEELNAPISLSEHDPVWPSLYEEEERRVQEALGGRALRIEHTGSTSVPGLAAKPIIDMLLVVADSADESSYVPDLERAGYVLRIREPGWREHRLLKRHDPDVNLHVHSHGDPEIGRIIAFRDRLRTDADERQRYEDAKRALARKRWKYVQNYADAKSGVIEEILSRALRD